MKNKIYWYFKGYEDELETVNWKVIDCQPDIASDAHALYDIMRHQATKSGGRLRFSEEKPFTPRLLVKTFLPWVPEDNGLKALEALIKSDLVHTQKGTFIISNSDEMFGHDTDMARYLRKHRQKANVSSNKGLSGGYQCKPDDNHLETPLQTTPIENQEHKNTPSIPLAGLSGKGDDDAFKTMAKDFYGRYPKQAQPDAVESWFLSARPAERTYVAMLIALDRDRASENWRKAGGRFVPLPANWLAKEPWTEEDLTNAGYLAEERSLNAGKGKPAAPETGKTPILLPEPRRIPEKGERV